MQPFFTIVQQCRYVHTGWTDQISRMLKIKKNAWNNVSVFILRSVYHY